MAHQEVISEIAGRYGSFQKNYKRLLVIGLHSGGIRLDRISDNACFFKPKAALAEAKPLALPVPTDWPSSIFIKGLL